MIGITFGNSIRFWKEIYKRRGFIFRIASLQSLLQFMLHEWPAHLSCGFPWAHIDRSKSCELCGNGALLFLFTSLAFVYLGSVHTIFNFHSLPILRHSHTHCNGRFLVWLNSFVRVCALFHCSSFVFVILFRTSSVEQRPAIRNEIISHFVYHRSFR